MFQKTGKHGENRKREASDKQRKWLLPARKDERQRKQPGSQASRGSVPLGEAVVGGEVRGGRCADSTEASWNHASAVLWYTAPFLTPDARCCTSADSP